MCSWKIPIYSNYIYVSHPTECVTLVALNFQLMVSKKKV